MWFTRPIISAAAREARSWEPEKVSEDVQSGSQVMHRHGDIDIDIDIDKDIDIEKWGHPISVMVFILYKLYVLLPYTNPTPKLSPHRRLCIYTFSPKNLLCMTYKRFEKWGHGEMSS